MFNPHIHHHHQHQQHQQQQQFQQHLRQLQQIFQHQHQHQQQPPPPPPPPQQQAAPPGHHVAHHHHQTPRAIAVPPQTGPPPRMVNLCQTTQTTIIAPNPMLQGALLMQQMQGNMRGFGMGGQQFRQFFAAGARSSLLGPVPMGVAIKSPIMGFPAARPYHPHNRFYNNSNASSSSIAATTSAPSSSSFPSSSSTTDTAGRQPDRKQDSEQTSVRSTEEQATVEAEEKSETAVAVEGDKPTQIVEEQQEEPAVKKRKTAGSETAPDAEAEILPIECDNNSNAEDDQTGDCILLEGGSTEDSDVEMLEESKTDDSCLLAPSPSGTASEENQPVADSLHAEEEPQAKDDSVGSPHNQDEGEEGVADGANKFYCYLCSITCHNQQNFRSHMNSISHQQRMMEIQHMSNACLVTLLPRVQETLQGAIKDGEKKAELKRWCATCQIHFNSSIMVHRRTKEHKLASRTAISSCTVCKKHFRTSQIFVEHLQSQEHKQKMEKLQEQDGCEALAKLTALDTDGFLVEEEEEEESSEWQDVEEGQTSEDQDQSENQDGWSSLKEVTLKSMSSDEQHDPDTVYGSSFFVPVAGFICRLCNKFYHFESSALHTHCKSLTHFQNLKKYKASLGQKEESAESIQETLDTTDELLPVTQTTTDCSEDTDGLLMDQNSPEPQITLTQPSSQSQDQQETEMEPTPVSCVDRIDEEEATSASPQPVDFDLTVEEPASDSTPAVEEANGNDEEEEEKEVPAAPGKKNASGKAKAAPKRRSTRANRR